MSITEEMRKVFDACTVMAGVEPDFECVYMTKGVALLYLDEIDAENARLREQIDAAHMSRLLTENENESLRELCAGLLTGYECGYGELCKGCTWDGIGDSKTFSCLPRVKARDLGVEVDE